MLDKDKKIIVFNFCPKRFDIDKNNLKLVREVYTNVYESLRSGFDDSIKLVGMIHTGDIDLPLLEIVDIPNSSIKLKIKNYLKYISSVDTVDKITQGKEYNDLLTELND